MIGKTTDCAARLSWMEEQVPGPGEGIKTIKQRGKKKKKNVEKKSLPGEWCKNSLNHTVRNLA